MKWLFVYLLFSQTILFSQNPEIIDSLAFYSNSNFPLVVNNKYNEALKQAQTAIITAETSKDIKEQASENYNLGKLYFELNKYNDANGSFLKSAALYNNLKPDSKQLATYYHLSLSYFAKHKIDTSALYLEKAKTIQALLKNPDKSELLNLQKAFLYKAKNKLNFAKDIFTAISTKPTSESILYAKIESLYQIGNIEIQSKKNNLAINYLNKALELNNETENLEQKSSILLALSIAHENILDKKNAYLYLKQHLNLKERISILNSTRLGIDDYTKFKESERLKEIIQTNNTIKEQEKTNKFSKLISILAIALISILSLLSLALYKNNIIRNHSNLMLKEKNSELEIAKDKAERASKARSEFLSTVSHELRTPLNAINGITHLLLEEKPKKEQIDYLTSLKFSGDYLTKFINEILEINKIESNNSEVELINFNLKKLIAGLHNSLKELALVNNNTLTLHIDPTIPEYLIGDPTKLSQIILNLINNALKFTKDGLITVIIKVNKIENDKKSIYFEITDTGIGIPESKLSTVFDSFSQGSIEVNRKYGGTGLGLTIVKKLVKMLGGKIKLKSVEGQGSTFSFKLAFKEGEIPLELEKTLEFDYMSKLKNKKILVVEDNKINQMITRKMLENKQVICKMIDNGEDAVNDVRENKYDMILMDVHLPGINGTIASELIRSFDKSTPIIALTAISLHENREMLLSFGMNEVITKPFIPEDFYTVIAQNI